MSKSSPQKPLSIITQALCAYGCLTIAKYQSVSGKLMCETSSSKCPEIKRKNSESGKNSYLSGRKPHKQIYENLPQETKDRMAWNRGKKFVPNNTILAKDSGYSTWCVRSRVIKDNLLPYECDSCHINSWKNKKIVLELDHIDGNNRNHSLENLRFLCPNCHSQTPTYKGRNINSGKKKVSNKELLTSLLSSDNIHKALSKVGLSPRGANYERCKKLLNEVNAHVDQQAESGDLEKI